MEESIQDYQVQYAKRKTIALQLCPDGKLLVRCPRGMSPKAIDAFVQSKRAWIWKHRQRQMAAQQLPKLTAQELSHLSQQAALVIPQRVAHYAPMLPVQYNRITIRHQRTRWGSCSGKGNLNFNCLLMLAPAPVVDYVVVHELCHLRELNHSARFWAQVESILPDYKTQRKWLKDHGHTLIGRLP